MTNKKQKLEHYRFYWEHTWPSRPILTGLFSFHELNKWEVLLNDKLRLEKEIKKTKTFEQCWILLLCYPIDMNDAGKCSITHSWWQNPIDWFIIMTCFARHSCKTLKTFTFRYGKYQNYISMLLKYIVNLFLHKHIDLYSKSSI